MTKKIIKAIIVSSIITVLPALVNVSMFQFCHIWIIFLFGVLMAIFQPNYKIFKDKSTEKPKDHGTEILIILAAYITQSSVIIEAAYLRFPESVKWDIFSFLGLILILTGFGIRTWSVYTLGKFFTMHISILKGHKIVQSGPYKYFRHPSYVGAFLMLTGSPILLHSWFTLIGAFILLPIVWSRRIHYEEKLLIEEFEEEYKEYCTKVKRIIPGIW